MEGRREGTRRERKKVGRDLQKFGALKKKTATTILGILQKEKGQRGSGSVHEQVNVRLLRTVKGEDEVCNDAKVRRI